MSLIERVRVLEYKKLDEPRGWLQKPLTGLTDSALPIGFGEIYAVKALPGQLRGNHYHLVATEWFFVLAGSVVAYLKDIGSGEQDRIELNEFDNKCLRIGPRVAHAFVNECSENPSILVAYTDRQFDSNDTVPFVLKTSTLKPDT